jgi:hypothetical protein
LPTLSTQMLSQMAERDVYAETVADHGFDPLGER